MLTFPELCHSCGGCWAVCPENAISLDQRELGVVETGQRNGISFVHGRLRVGEAMAPPLIISKDEIDEGVAIMDRALNVADVYAKN